MSQALATAQSLAYLERALSGFGRSSLCVDALVAQCARIAFADSNQIEAIGGVDDILGLAEHAFISH